MDKQVVAAIQEGLPLTERPWEALAKKTGVSENTLLEETKRALAENLIKRFGLVIKHRSLGYVANAMVVWNVPDEQVSDIGQRMSRYPFVRLCYQRPRRLPEWPYNLFCMIHAQSRQEAMDHLETLITAEDLNDLTYEVLFSLRCFKQRGARY